ncbi:hypothetical protein EHQ53_00985 [Leptospira langatensis]|uniref:Uncharacterized protein n=1 Tax=Leptospira langatensis TaxID=2484983 RepID=A0A5F1ZWJ8_9LEPT|nr:tetratricopeptide repeat protein [Leptospira langatensis]TGJ98332.1 hypothetical protein EHO57_17130 [Leptospira langatensis]TGL43245.1 hypothetical protein EHQ53_00985 [Leptospira langatensis]
MKKTLLLFIILFPCTWTHIHAQKLENNQTSIQKALHEVEGASSEFNSNLEGQLGLDFAVDKLIKDKRIQPENEFHQFVLGNLLLPFKLDLAFQYHEAALKKRPNDQNFVMEYAIDLHRKQEFARAVEYYKKFAAAFPKYNDIYVWLADCYINLDDPKAAVYYWHRADHARHHANIDFAIYTIYGVNTYLKRNLYLSKLRDGQKEALYELIALDAKWDTDWWNFHTKMKVMQSDIDYAIKKFGNNNEAVRISIAFQKIKASQDRNLIKTTLKKNNLIIENGKIPENGSIASHLLEICIQNKLVDAADFYNKRGNEVLALAKTLKDERMLNIYAHMQLAAKGVVDPETALLGWKEFKDEMFAYDFFFHKTGKLNCDQSELDKAIKDFPNSSLLYSIKYECNKNSFFGESKKTLLIGLIKREFKSLSTDPMRYSYKLKHYFNLLEKEL